MSILHFKSMTINFKVEMSLWTIQKVDKKQTYLLYNTAFAIDRDFTVSQLHSIVARLANKWLNVALCIRVRQIFYVAKFGYFFSPLRLICKRNSGNIASFLIIEINQNKHGGT